MPITTNSPVDQKNNTFFGVLSMFKHSNGRFKHSNSTRCGGRVKYFINKKKTYDDVSQKTDISSQKKSKKGWRSYIENYK